MTKIIWSHDRSTIPKLERVFDRSIKAFLPGLFRMDRLAREMSAVTRVIVILERKQTQGLLLQSWLYVALYFHINGATTKT